MNIFAIDQDPLKAATHLHDKLVVKMTLESAQLLSTAIWSQGVVDSNLYKPTHVNHPSNIWVRASFSNYLWLLEHFLSLCKEYTYRYRRVHACEQMYSTFYRYIDLFPYEGLTPFALAMPDKYKQLNAIQSYRNYYIGEKIINKTWTRRAIYELDSWLSFNLNINQFKC